METLIGSGAMKKEGDHLVILSNIFEIDKDEERTINQTGLVFDRFISTIIYNRHAKGKAKRYQYSYKSTKVPPSDRVDFHEMMYAHSVKSMNGYIDIINKFEADVPNGHYPECGISMFEFDAKNNKQGEDNE
ncbi:MAG: hypothetical protein JKX98_06265 [Alcanivoracaceae bacterium]|nr:hypothetical protein [Alcanivoracaceae bacterium]